MPMINHKRNIFYMDFYDIPVQPRKGEETTLREYAGKVLLIVNTATGCGLTPQYEELEQMYRRHKEKGFEILDFPCNQFLEQAKGDDEQINSFCTARYDTTFPRFKKIDVNGPNAAPLFRYLKEQQPRGTAAKGKWFMSMMIRISSFFNHKSGERGDIRWNFTKFLVDRQGRVVERFEPTVTAEQIEPAIEKLL